MLENGWELVHISGMNCQVQITRQPLVKKIIPRVKHTVAYIVFIQLSKQYVEKTCLVSKLRLCLDGTAGVLREYLSHLLDPEDH